MNKQERERRALLTLETENAADVFREFIKTCRAEDMSWDEIAKITKLPRYCVRVIAGEIRKNRMLPEYARQCRR